MGTWHNRKQKLMAWSHGVHRKITWHAKHNEMKCKAKKKQKKKHENKSLDSQTKQHKNIFQKKSQRMVEQRRTRGWEGGPGPWSGLLQGIIHGLIYGLSPATIKYHDCRAWAGLDRGVGTGGYGGSETWTSLMTMTWPACTDSLDLTQLAMDNLIECVMNHGQFINSLRWPD